MGDVQTEEGNGQCYVLRNRIAVATYYILPCYQSCPRHTTPPAPPATKARRGGLVHISFCHSVHYRKRITVYLLFTFFFSFHNSIMGYVSGRAGMYDAHVPISSSSSGTIMTRVCLFFPMLAWSCTGRKRTTTTRRLG